MFGIVDEMVAHAEYFLLRARESSDFLSIRADVVAFSSSSRSITYCVQAALADAPGFEEWYSVRRAALKASGLARYFHNYRRIAHHLGENSICQGVFRGGRTTWYFVEHGSLPTPPVLDVAAACTQHFIDLLRVVFECYEEFRYIVNGQWYYTEENFARRGLTIEDAEEELGFPRGHTKVESWPDCIRWRLLCREAQGCGIQHIFSQWLNRTVQYPDLQA